jgi:hypothetical protein
MSQEIKKKGICLDCEKQACFNLPNIKPPIYCGIHKQPNMVNVKDPKCIEENCSTRPTYGLPNGKATYCSIHKKDNMVNLKSPKCQHENCNTIPTFGVPGGKALYCINHKTIDMINVKCKTCAYTNCTKQPGYGLVNGKPEYCTEHKLPNMVNLHDKTCIVDGCKTLPTFGLVKGVLTHCAKQPKYKFERLSFTIKCILSYSSNNLFIQLIRLSNGFFPLAFFVLFCIFFSIDNASLFSKLLIEP